MAAHLLRCQRLTVDDYSFAHGRLAAGLPSAFDQLGFRCAYVNTDLKNQTDEAARNTKNPPFLFLSN